jgi:hypothetical protein
VAQGVGPEFKPQYHKKKKERKKERPWRAISVRKSPGKGDSINSINLCERSRLSPRLSYACLELM